MKKQVKICIAVALAGLFLFSTGMLLFQMLDVKRSQNDYAQIASLVQEEKTPIEPATLSEEELEQSAYNKYHQHFEQNNDFIGWVKVPGTKLNYPVMQTPDRKDYYLKRNFSRQYSDYGVPFMQENCIVDISDNLLIYGHNMKDGTMFSGLELYADKTFYEKHKEIQFDTIQSFGRYEVVAVFRTVAYTQDAFRYYDFVDAASEEEFDAYIDKCKELSLYPIETSAKYGDRLLTLSTCEYTQKDGRFVVVAKLMDE